jgi:hypothetical protein
MMRTLSTTTTRGPTHGPGARHGSVPARAGIAPGPRYDRSDAF